MQQMEAETSLLLAEIRRMIKIDSTIQTVMQTQKSPDLDAAQNPSQLRDNFERIIKSQKCTVLSITKQLQKCQS